MKHIPLLTAIVFFCNTILAQEKKALSEKETKDILAQVSKSIKNSSKDYSEKACTCIDSIDYYSKSQNEISLKVAACIDKSVELVQMNQLVMEMVFDTNSNSKKEYTVNVNKESSEYKKTYYELERALMDSCVALKNIVNVNDKPEEHSFSKDKTAMSFYSTGNDFSDKGKLKEALESYYQAVKIDPLFVFCWDNIGVCERKLGNYDKAIDAYNKSLDINPKGATALQNLPVVYQFLKKYDLAIKAYKKLIKVDNKNPEGYFGVSRMQIITGEMEEALGNMCKAYNLYIELKSPYRSDAEKMISLIYTEMKKENKLDKFNAILKDNNISPMK